MLSHLHIKDFAIIDNMNVEFHEGLNIITGETGAGKSIIIEAVNLALGSRADTAFVRSGKSKAVIKLVIEDCPEGVVKFLDNEGITVEDGQLIIHREISSQGKSLCKINGSPVPVAFLNSVCRRIADVHGQYDHQSLLDPGSHITILDTYAHEKILNLKKEISAIYTEYTSTKSALQELIQNEAKFREKQELMAFQLEEITNARLKPGEDDALEASIKLMQNSEKIFQGLSSCYDIVYEKSQSAFDLLSQAQTMLEASSEFSTGLSELLVSFNEAYYTLEDLKSGLRRERDHISYSEEELDSSIQRLEVINALKRKYGSSIPKILAHKEELESQLNLAKNSEEMIAKFSESILALERDLKLKSEELSKLRKAAASKLETEISQQLKDLSFSSAEFNISFTEIQFSPSGTDAVEFLMSTNKGEPLKALAKIASGGEMSRIMLAFKKIISEYDEIGTLIFDEIDTGISGIAASIVGQKLKEISRGRQIICITHLPQIAACGLYNYRILKESDESSTYTSLLELNEEEKISEIARLLGGINVTESTITSAKELIAASV